MRIADVDVLIQPGWENSGPGHWQRRWGERFPHAHFIEQDDWQHPLLADWIARIGREVMMATRPVILVAHSLGASAVVHAAQHFKDAKVRGAFLVSPPDLESDELLAELPPEIATFRDVPRDPLPFPSMVVVSTNDGFVTVERAADMAAAWGSQLELAGASGHINTASGHGPWPEGLLMFHQLMKRLKA
jgi:predicted alpha/beta hydrolase family esterase